ncbi:MAG: M20/M25/M40 family metallo-hydrolase [Myxococcales bacterium]|nr:M20/M25/M40 family metallo-hydrolase [Myxococcales bacterium]
MLVRSWMYFGVTFCGFVLMIDDTVAQIPQNQPIVASLTEDASVLLAENVLVQGRPYARLVELCDRFGHRLSGSTALEQSIDWAVDELRAAGITNARRESVTVPRWVRGKESLHVVAPRAYPMAMLGLGGSVGTGPHGIEADVMTVSSEDELDALGAAVAGKIVHFDNPMPSWTPQHGSCYGETVIFRVHGAAMAAKYGAIAVLVRSVTARSLRSPHTGMLSYQELTTPIPAAAISTEDSEYLRRQKDAQTPVRVRLQMDAFLDKDAQSANVVADVVGDKFPEQIVIVSGHIDSWDVGQGAHDDGAGVVMAMDTLVAIHRMGWKPKRTVRLVLWTNEENGMRGVKSYIERHQSTLHNHVAAIEADAGGFAPIALAVQCADKQRESTAAIELAQLVAKLSWLNPNQEMTVKPGSSAPDVAQLVPSGVLALGLDTYGETYFDYHHSEADTVDKVNPDELRRSAAALAAVTWFIADHPYPLGISVQVSPGAPESPGGNKHADGPK